MLHSPNWRASLRVHDTKNSLTGISRYPLDYIRFIRKKSTKIYARSYSMALAYHDLLAMIFRGRSINGVKECVNMTSWSAFNLEFQPTAHEFDVLRLAVN